MGDDGSPEPISLSDAVAHFEKQHDWLSLRFAWHEQHLYERFLDLGGLMHSISRNVEEERLDYKMCSFPGGFFEVEQPSRVRYVKVIFLFTIFERRVRALCRLVSEVDTVAGLSLDELRGTLSERVKEFLRARLSVNVSELVAWDQVQTVQKVRDCILHCGGRVSESRDEQYLRLLSSGARGLSVSDWDYLYIDTQFVEAAEGAILAFLDALLPEVHGRLREKWLLLPLEQRIEPRRGAR